MSQVSALLFMYAAVGCAMGLNVSLAIRKHQQPSGFLEGFYVGTLGALAAVVWPVVLGCALWSAASGHWGGRP